MKQSTQQLLERISRETGIPLGELVESLKLKSIRLGIPFDEVVEIHNLIRHKGDTHD